MDFERHPIFQNVRTFSPSSVERREARRMANELEDLFTSLTTMSLGDVAALPSLKQAIAVLMNVTQHFGSVGGWTSAQHNRLYTEANRLLGPGQLEFNQPNLQEL